MDRPALELTLLEARMRLAQLVRLADAAGQRTVIVDAGRPLAALVPITVLHAERVAAADAGRVAAADAGRLTAAAVPGESAAGAAGWVRRLEKVRADLHEQHNELRRALDRTWELLDAARPPGTDPGVDALRVAHADLRRPG